MARKKYTNPVLEACRKTLQKKIRLDNRISEQYQIAGKAKRKAAQLEYQRRLYHVEMCKEITDEILSRDLGLNDTEYAFLNMPMRYKGSSQRTHIRLLEDLVRRNFHAFYPPPSRESVISLSRIYTIVGIETKLSLFFKNLNKKFEGILEFRLGNLNFRRLESYEDKITVQVDFLPKDP